MAGPAVPGAPAAKANVLPDVGSHKAVEVTFPRRNSDAGRAPYSIKSETYDPRSANY